MQIFQAELQNIFSFKVSNREGRKSKQIFIFELFFIIGVKPSHNAFLNRHYRASPDLDRMDEY